jgi:SAM-dependent methyltransferase
MERSARVNDYSAEWIRTFLETVPPERTAKEVAFLCAALPLFTHARILDVPCGDGRHARPLALAGYAVTGVDANGELIERARSRWRTEEGAAIESDEGDPRAPVFRVHDMRDLQSLDDTFDAVICMWASFGFLDTAGNAAVLAQLAGRLRPGGRLVLDVYNRGFFETRQGSRQVERAGSTIVEDKRCTDGRLTVTLSYPNGHEDRFEWQVFTPDALVSLARESGLAPIAQCCGFDPATAPSPDVPGMQLVLERI